MYSVITHRKSFQVNVQVTFFSFSKVKQVNLRVKRLREKRETARCIPTYIYTSVFCDCRIDLSDVIDRIIKKNLEFGSERLILNVG